MVGLLPLCAATVVEPESLGKLPRLRAAAMQWFLDAPAGAAARHRASPDRAGRRRAPTALAASTETELRRVLARMLDENEFLGPLRHPLALALPPRRTPTSFDVGGQEYRVDYEPAESSTGLFGGNSNWRGPVWFPVNYLIIESLQQFHYYYGDEFKVECPTGSGADDDLLGGGATRFRGGSTRLFLRDADGRRPVYGGAEKFQTDPHWRDLILFYEYFHGDNGAGIGASHQTGWTGLVAKLIQMSGYVASEGLSDG